MKKIITDHGGNLDETIIQYGGLKSEWIDLSTGINQNSYPIPKIPDWVWKNLPDKSLVENFIYTARNFWNVPTEAEIISASGTSAIINTLPSLFKIGNVDIYNPCYSEYEIAFQRNGWKTSRNNISARVLINPNNPDGKIWHADNILEDGKLTIIDESFCDLVPEKSLISYTKNPGVIVLKSFGKFWGLAGLRFGCAIGLPKTLQALKNTLGPWAASGPALFIANSALSDRRWITNNRARLNKDVLNLDKILLKNDIKVIGGTSLFRLISIKDPKKLQDKLCQRKILTRTFPYSEAFLRLGIPHKPEHWKRIENALRDIKL